MEHENHSHYEHYEHHEHHEPSPKKKDLTEKLRTNPWIISTFVLGILAAILIVGSVSGGITGKIISEDEVAELALSFVESQIGGEIEILDVSKESGIYKIDFESEKIGVSSVYLTLDGKYFISGLMSLAVEEEEETELIQTQGYSEEDLEKIKDFSECLAEKGMKVYGAGWCGHCQNLIRYFGGEESIAPIFIECSDAQRNPTEYAELCTQEGIQGYPTIKINGIDYQNARTFEAFAEATDCPVPEVVPIN